MTDNPGYAELIWKEPPPKQSPGAKKSPGQTELTLRAMRERPGEWALLRENTSLGFVSIYKKQADRLFGGRWEFTSRRTGQQSPAGNPLIDLYGRYLGE